jgi:hypothetical protein
METFPGKVLPPIPMDTTIKETTTSVPTDFGNNPISPALEGYYNADGRKIGGYRVIANHFVNLIDNMEIEKAKNLRLDR